MQKFDTPAPVSAVLDVPAGRIRFLAADRADTEVEILPADAAKGRDVKAAKQATVAYGDGVLRIEAGPARHPVSGGIGSLAVTVRLPAGSHVEAKAAGADFQGVGRLGDVAFEGARGSLDLDEAASVRIALLAGDVTVGRLGGRAEISTHQGDITVAGAVRGTVVLRTGSGDICVSAAREVSACLDAGTAHGRISNALKNTGDAAGLTIHATTGHGDIAARSL